jgi:hypothetical protein
MMHFWTSPKKLKNAVYVIIKPEIKDNNPSQRHDQRSQQNNLPIISQLPATKPQLCYSISAKNYKFKKEYFNTKSTTIEYQ